jgi:hypothetical protein
MPDLKLVTGKKENETGQEEDSGKYRENPPPVKKLEQK